MKKKYLNMKNVQTSLDGGLPLAEPFILNIYIFFILHIFHVAYFSHVSATLVCNPGYLFTFLYIFHMPQPE